MIQSVFAASAILLLQSEPSSNLTVAELQNILQTGDADSISAEDCERAYEQAPILNGPSLFLGASYCAAAEQALKSASLLHFGQIRSTTDLALSIDTEQPDFEPDPAAVELWGMIYFQFGGTADMAIWADSDSAALMLSDLESFEPERPDGYQPGWVSNKAIDDEVYAAAIEEQRQYRLGQLRVVARLGQNDDYVALSEELAALQAANLAGFNAGTTDSKRANTIMEAMAELYDAASQAQD